MNRFRRISTVPFITGALLPFAWGIASSADNPARGAGASSGGLEEIIVTATRREESQARVPISITAYTQAQLDVNNVRTMDDVARMTPGVQFRRTGDLGAVADITIRGIQSNAGVGTNGVYIDDTPVQSRQDLGGLGSAVWPYVFDLERVEVLRGPQGTLFGSGSMGGNVRFITPTPSTTKTSFYARTEASFTQSGGPNTELGLAFNLPLVENMLGLRMSAYYRHDGGYVDRWDYWGEHVNEENSNYSDIKSFRVAATYQPIENLSITPSFYWQKVFINDSSRYWLPLSDADSNRYNRAGNIPNQQEDRFSLPGLKVQWDVGNLSFFSNTSYFDRTQPAIQDLAAFEASIWAGQYYPPPGMYAPSKEYVSQQVFTQEFRIQNTDADARLTWVGGVFYQRAKQRYIEMVQNTFLPGLIWENFGQTIEEVLGSGLVDGKYTVVVDPFDTIDKHLAAFGQVDFKFTDKLKGTFGLRVERADLWSHILYSGPVNGPVPVTTEGSGSETPVTPKFSLSYQLNDGTMLYTTVAKGYRIGGVNQPISVNCGTDLTDIGLAGHPTTYGSDSLWSYELGGKFRSTDGRYALDASIYRINWTDLQVNYSLPTCGFSFTTNAGAITSDGVELAFKARPIDQLTFGVSLGYTKASTDRDTWFGNATEPTLPGQKPMLPGGSRQLVAPYTAAVDAQYSFSAYDHDSYFRVNYNYADGLNSGLSWQNPKSGNYNPTVKGLPIRQDLTLKLGTHFGALDVAVFCNNALDEHPLLGHGHATRSNPIYTAYAIRPRTLGLTASYRY